MLFVSFLLVTGCQSKDKEETNSEQQSIQNEGEGTDLLPMAQDGEGYAFGLYDGNKFEEDRTFKISTDSFTRTIKVDNKTKAKEQLLVLVFDGDKQITYQVNNKDEKHYTFNVDSNKEGSVEITVPNLAKGYHPLYYVVVRSPYKQTRSLEEDLSYQQVLSTKVNILKDIENIPNPNKKYTSVASKTDSSRVDGVLIGEKKNPYRALMKGKTRKDNEFKYQVTYGNQGDKEEKVYVVSLLNWEQTPVSKKEETIYDSLSPGTEKTFFSRLNRDLPKKENILTILLLPGPYEPMEDNASLLNDPSLSNRTVVTKK